MIFGYFGRAEYIVNQFRYFDADGRHLPELDDINPVAVHVDGCPFFQKHEMPDALRGAGIHCAFSHPTRGMVFCVGWDSLEPRWGRKVAENSVQRGLFIGSKRWDYAALTEAIAADDEWSARQKADLDRAKASVPALYR